jgi:4-diphosphocytidyl-2-C-methyl-D-erythritol kinase
VERQVKPKPLTFRSYAKVNLGLEVLGTRQDGYHELRTLFQTIDLHDEITLRTTGGEISVSCDHPGVPGDASNLAARAAEALRRHAGIASGVAIEIAKRIPVAGGLGGGSSNAASVLLALDRFWTTGLGISGLLPIARRLGADVPFFLVGGTALGLARGDEIYPLRRQVRARVVVVDPGLPVSTARVFARVDASLTARENSHSIIRFISKDLEGTGDAYPVLANELERFALEEVPELARQIARIRVILDRGGAQLSSLSGSGSAFFGLFNDARRARRAQRALAAEGFSTFGCRTLSLDQYRGTWSRTLGSPGWNQGGHHGNHRRESHPR